MSLHSRSAAIAGNAGQALSPSMASGWEGLGDLSFPHFLVPVVAKDHICLTSLETEGCLRPEGITLGTGWSAV